MPESRSALPRLAQLLGSARLLAKIALRSVADDDVAQRECFLGSPGADHRDDFGLHCRVYRAPAGVRGTPLDEWVLNVLSGARA